jgi:hypothetical protein
MGSMGAAAEYGGSHWMIRDLRTVRFIAQPKQYIGKATIQYLLTTGYGLTEYWCRIDEVLVSVSEENPVAERHSPAKLCEGI